MKLNLGCGNYPLDGFENLDRTTGWELRDGLPYPDSSVEAITVSHLLMYVSEPAYPDVLSEFFRVLVPGGVLRITECDTRKDHESFGAYVWSSRPNPVMMRIHLQDAGFKPVQVDANTTLFRDRSLLQDRHGPSPKVFFMEAIKCLP